MSAGKADKNPLSALLAAESSAAAKIKSEELARDRKLKDAEEEARKKALEYKASLEVEYKKQMNSSSGGDDEVLKKLKISTEQERKIQEDMFAANKDTVAQLLLHYVTTVELSVSSNLEQLILADDRARRGREI